MSSLAETISEYLVDLSLEKLPQSPVEEVKSLILDYLGVASAGTDTESGRIARTYALENGGRPISTIIGSGVKSAPSLAAFTNAISAHSIELDDVDDLALYHFSPAVVSAALACGEKRDCSGKDFLVSVYAGCEVMGRLSLVMNPSLRDRGFHTTPVCGVFGAAAAAGMLLGLKRDEMVSALALAGAQACGLMQFYGQSLQKRFNTGPPARNGVCAAEMAKLGYTGSADILEGKKGLFRAFSDIYDPAVFLEKLGETFPSHIDFKPYSAARPIHNGVDCALDILKQGVQPDTIEEITLFRHPDWADYHLIYNPGNMNEAQVSMPYSVAVALHTGDAFLDQYQEPYLSDPEVNRIMNLIRIKPDSGLPRGVSCLMVVKVGGQTYQSQVDYPKGSKENPFTSDEFERKFKRLSSSLLTGADQDQTIERVLNIEKIGRVGEIIQVFQTTGNA